MPLFEFKCPTCDHQTEHIMKFADAEENPPLCAKCAEASQVVQMLKMISRTSFELKGGGWYKDGYQK